ncbi:MAG TPA: hypothetical protein VNS32_05755 [Flavisolibacter sp.]|nr:hypothetical protein [Flavisolibacter sp.]
MNNIYIFEKIKSAFCGLVKYKERGSTLEIITPFTTLNNKFVSVFLKEQEGKYIISDGGWVLNDYYNSLIDEDAEEILSRILTEYQETFAVRSQAFPKGTYYYKVCDNIEMIPSQSFDVANFISAIANSRGIKYRDEKEIKEKEKFRTEANDFLATHFKDSVRFRKNLDDFPHIKYNAIIQRSDRLYLFSYITGSTPYYFDNELRKSIVNFEIADRSSLRFNINEKIALINDKANGYNSERSAPIFELLNERSSINITWTRKNDILEVVR